MVSSQTFSLLAIVFFLTQVVSAQTEISKEEYGIYSVAIREFFKEKRKENPEDPENRFVIISETEKSRDDPGHDRRAEVGLRRSFRLKNRTSLKFEPKFSIPYNVSLVTQGEIDALIHNIETEYKLARDKAIDKAIKENRPMPGGFCGPEWTPFYQRFPGASAIYSLSRIGFSNDHRAALLSLSAKGASGYSENALCWMKWTPAGWRIERVSGGMGVC